MSKELIKKARHALEEEFAKLEDKSAILRSKSLKDLYAKIPKLPAEDRAAFGQQVNELKDALTRQVEEFQAQSAADALPAIDVTAPLDFNADVPELLPATLGSVHPISSEIDSLVSIFERMGFRASESRHLDDEHHMFDTLNFPKDHPARDHYDTFRTTEGLIAPAHTSTMQHRILREYSAELEQGRPIAVLVPDRVFRNEDVDATHEHTFHQFEGIYVSQDASVGNLISTLKTALEHYFHKELDVKTQPFYFPFTEPSFEFAMSCPFCDKEGCSVCSHTGWIEILGCGMIHPNVLEMAGINPNKYSGYAWGGGIERLIMMKYSVEDVRHFHSGNLAFLRQF